MLLKRGTGYSIHVMNVHTVYPITLQWRYNERDGVSNHQPHDCLLNRLFRRRSKKASELRVTGLCEGNSPGTGEFPTQRASNEENVSILRRHHEICTMCFLLCFVMFCFVSKVTPRGSSKVDHHSTAIKPVEARTACSTLQIHVYPAYIH